MKFDGYRFDKVKAEYDPSADLISREETLTAFADYVGSGMSMNDFDALWDIVVKMPAVNPTKTGYWIDDNENEIDAQYGRHLYKCSECNEYADMFVGGTEDWWDLEKPNYCPNCGAKMVEPQAESEE